MNSLIEYLYRDASNYKSWNSCIIQGELTGEDCNIIIDCLSEGEYFIPHQVGLPEKRFSDGLTEDDHCWFELEPGFCSLTEAAPTVPLTATALVKAFQEAKNNWDDSKYAIGSAGTNPVDTPQG